VVRLGIEFETAYPSLFLDISKQMRATLSDQKIIAIVIADFSEGNYDFEFSKSKHQISAQKLKFRPKIAISAKN